MIDLVYDRDDRLEPAIELEALNDQARGTAVVEVIPGSGARRIDRSSLLLDLAAALGKRVADVQRLDDTHLPRQLVAWLRAAPVNEIVVARAHLAHGGHWRYLTKVVDAADAHLTLLLHGEHTLTRSQREFLRDATVATIDFSELTSRLRRRQRPEPPAPAAAEPHFPLVPHDVHWLTFRKACERLLPRKEFLRVRDLFDQTLRETRRWTAARPNLTSVQLLRELRRTTPHGASFDETLTILSAVACALWEQEWQLNYKLDQLAATLDLNMLPRLDQHRCALIATEVRPDRAAAAVLTLLLSQLPHAEPWNLNLEDVAADGSTVTVAEETHTVPPFARQPLRAQLQVRHDEDTGPHDPFVPRPEHPRAHANPRRHTAASWDTFLTTTGKRLGLRLKPRSSAPKDADDWARQRGIRITPFASRIKRLLAEAA